MAAISPILLLQDRGPAPSLHGPNGAFYTAPTWPQIGPHLHGPCKSLTSIYLLSHTGTPVDDQNVRKWGADQHSFCRCACTSQSKTKIHNGEWVSKIFDIALIRAWYVDSDCFNSVNLETPWPSDLEILRPLRLKQLESLGSWHPDLDTLRLWDLETLRLSYLWALSVSNVSRVKS